MDELVGMMKETGAFFGTHIAPWLMVAIAIIVPVLCLPIYRSAKKLLAAWDGEDEAISDTIDRKLDRERKRYRRLFSDRGILFGRFCNI